MSPVTSLPPPSPPTPLPASSVEQVAVTRFSSGVLTRLGQLSGDDLSAFYRRPPNLDGTRTDRQTDLFLAAEGGRRAGLVQAGGHLADCTITHSTHDGGRGIAAIRVFAVFRRRGVGPAAQPLAGAPGRWRMASQDYDNAGTCPFGQHPPIGAMGPARSTHDDALHEGRPADTGIGSDTSVGGSGRPGGVPC